MEHVAIHDEAAEHDKVGPQRAAATPQRIEIGAGLQGAGVWEGYRATIAKLFDVALPEGADPEAFVLESAVWQAVQTSLRRSRSSAQTLQRGPGLIAHGADQIILYVHLAGRLDHRCGDAVARIGPGDVVVYDYAQPIESTTGDFENLVLMLDRRVAPPPLLAAPAHGFRIPACTGVAELLVAGIEALEARAGRLSMAEFEAAALAVAGLAAEPVRAQAERESMRLGAGAGAAQVHGRALAYVDAHLADRGLNPERIAAHLDLSRSALYRLMEPYGGVRLLILGRRLDHAVRALLDDPHSHRALGEVARRHGFLSSAHFSRLFAKRFGMPPSEYCALVRHGDTAWLAAQYARTRFPSDVDAAWRQLGARRS